MKNPVCFLPLLAGLILNVASSTWINGAAEEGDSEVERVINGRNAVAGQFPWSAALFRHEGFICTCSIIGETTVLTAAHCVVNRGVTGRASEFHAIANVNKSSREVRIEFASVTPHPEYSESGIQNDIAILKTTEPIPFSDNVQPICIARNDTAPREYRNVLAMGWGDTRRFRVVPFIPEILQYAEQRVVGTFACRVSYFLSPLEDYKICAGDFNIFLWRISGICNGDSGGPLVSLERSEPVQVGIASYGNAISGCGTPVPSVWTRTSFFNSFIKDEAGEDPICDL